MKWNTVMVKDVAQQVRGVSYKPSDVSEQRQDGYVPILRANNITDNGLTRNDLVYVRQECVSAKQMLQEGDILIAASSGSKHVVGKSSYVHTPDVGSFGAFCKVVRPNENVDSRYLSYFFQSPGYRRTISHLSAGANINNIRTEDIDQLVLPFPPLPIQRQIADTLDKADALRQKNLQLLQKYDELAQAIFYEMFGDPVSNDRGWSELKLIEVCDQITDGTHFSPPNVETGVPYITAKHVKITGVDFYADPTYVSENDHREIYSRCKPVKGDILYIKDGATTGIAAVNEYDFPFSMLSSLALIKPKRDILNNQYLRFWLNNPQVKDMYLREYMAGAAIKRFTLQKIKQFRVVVPPFSLQNKFGRLVIKLSESRRAKEQSLIKSSDLFDTLINQSF